MKNNLTQKDMSPGLECLKEILKNLPEQPGSYRMIDEENRVLYVGKAKNIKARVRSYTHWDTLPTRLKRMVHQTRRLEVVVTQTEAEALLLEANLINRFKPPFNVLLRDDKSFPYILIAQDHDFPQLMIYRGPQTRKGFYFGPFPSSSTVHQTLPLLQKAFLLRSCSDSVFESRKRPCLLYDIKRCSAPCVGKISQEDYKNLVLEAKNFLKGRNHTLQETLRHKMSEASFQECYEEARIFRDRMRALGYIQSHQNLSLNKKGRLDVVAVAHDTLYACIQVFSYQNSQNLGNRPYFFTLHEEQTARSLLKTFLPQFYSLHEIPDEILLSHSLCDSCVLLEALATLKHQRHQKGIKLSSPKRGVSFSLVQQAITNAQEALTRHKAERLSFQKIFQQLQDIFRLPSVPQRVEVYDNSHLHGTNAYGVMIVVTQEGFLKQAYRKFLIKDPHLSPGDDCGMMHHVLSRRLKPLSKKFPLSSHNENDFPPDSPDLILLDGGRGQLNVAKTIQENFPLPLIVFGAIAKGAQRSGDETIYRDNQDPLRLAPNDPLLYFFQKIRDEAHRFAIKTHRQKRIKTSLHSQLDEIPGIGPTRKRALLSHFGSAQDIAQAPVSELTKVEGISEFLAQNLYSYFHET